jgi:hypothetical protein
MCLLLLVLVLVLVLRRFSGLPMNTWRISLGVRRL